MRKKKSRSNNKSSMKIEYPEKIVELAETFNKATIELETTAFSKAELEKAINGSKESEKAMRQLNAELIRRVAEQTAEIRKSYRAVEAERQQFKDVLDQLPAYLVLLSPDYRVPFANRFFEERFGKSEGRRCYEYLFNRTEPCEICETFSVLKTNAPHRWEWTGPDGHNYDIFDYPFRDTEGNMLIMEVGLDITEFKKTHSAMQAERRRLFDVLETLPVMICLLTPDYHVSFANRSFRDRFGESQGRHCYEYCFGKTSPCEFCESYKVLETGRPHHWEVAAPDGSVIDAYDFPFTDADGTPMVLEMDIDVTEQKRAQNALDSVSQNTRSLIEASMDPLVTISAEGKITDVNEAAIKVTGVPRAKLIGTDFSDYFTEPEKARQGYRRVFNEGFVKDYPLTVRHKDGTLTDVLYNATVYKDTRGNVLGVFAAARDVTEKKRAEQELDRYREHLEELVGDRTKELRRSEASLARAQEIAHLGSWELDLVHDVLTWSDEVYRIFGLQPNEFGATYEAFLERVHPEDRDSVDAAYSGSVRQGKNSYEIEHRVVRADSGEVRFVHEKCEHFRDEAGKIVRSVGMVHDITEQKQHEQQLKRSNENLEQFAYVASHDLQEPLRVMASYSQLLERRYKEKLDQDAKDFIEFIVDAASRMQTLITDLLAYSRAGRQNLKLSRVDCNEVMRKVTAMLSKTIEAVDARVTWDKLPVVAGAEINFVQLFQNLIGNGLKFRGSKPPEISVSARDNNNEWIFSVGDNGIGIEPQYKQRIFQIFQRLHSRGEHAGTGIGLSICKKIVENWEGRIWVESEPDEGSIFYFTVPKERRQCD